MPLEEYRRKRDFAKTPEPAPGRPAGAAAPVLARRRFVVQKHRATRLHYDFRLEIDGVLASWAVPKGPTLDSTIRRMAVHVEDHPMEYFDFEGVIPARQYGAGDVIVWDWGTWEPEAETPDPAAAVANGELKFVLSGEKVKGRFTIVRTSRRPGTAPRTAFEDDEGEQWLLIHKKGPDNVSGWDAEDYPQSVKSGRTNDEVKANAPAIWVSAAPASTAEIDLSAARDAPMPRYLEPMKATLATKAFRDEDWLYELKWDGYRVEAVVRDGKTQLFTRNGNDAEAYFPRLLNPPTWIDAREAIVDGEVVALDERGHPDFSLLQVRISEGRTGRPVPLVYQAFDLLYLDGRSLVDVPLESRKRLLELVIRPTSRVQYGKPIETEGLAFFEAVKAQGLEGIVAKHRRSRYEPGRRASSWLKIKARPEQELVVGGWTPGEGSAKDAGRGGRRRLRGRQAQVLGQGRVRVRRPDAQGAAGAARRASRRTRRRSTRRPRPDYRGRWGGDLAGVRWIRPELVIRAEIGGWTRDGHVRQTAFKGLERGRDPREVVRERAVDPAKADREAAEAFPAPESVASAMERTKGSTAMAKTTTKREAKATKAKATKATAPDPTWVVAEAELERPGLDEARGPVARVGAGAEGHQPRQGAVPAPRRRRRARADQARPHRLLRAHRPGDAAAPRRPTAQPAALPERRRRAGLLAEGHPVDRRRSGSRSGTRPASASARTGRRTTTSSPTARRPCAGSATRRRSRSTPGPPRSQEPWMPTFALIDIDPGTKTTWDETLVLARLYRTALEHLGVRAYPKLTGSRGIQAWIPIERGRYEYATRRAWVEKLSRAIGGTVPRPRVVGVGEGRSRRQGAPRLHPERGDQDARGAVRGPAAAGRPGLRADPLGGARRPDARAPTAGRSDARRRASPRSATCGRASRRTARSCRRSDAPGAPRRRGGITRNDGQGRAGFRRGPPRTTMPRGRQGASTPSPLARPMAQRRRSGTSWGARPASTPGPARAGPLREVAPCASRSCSSRPSPSGPRPVRAPGIPRPFRHTAGRPRSRTTTWRPSHRTTRTSRSSRPRRPMTG